MEFGGVLIQLSNPMNSCLGIARVVMRRFLCQKLFWGLNKLPKKLLSILNSYQSFNFSRKICADLTAKLT
jgi:hypothetical protein